MLTNIPYLHELTRHCSGEHQHVPGEKWEDHTPEFAQVYCNLLLRSLGPDRIFFLECWGNHLTKYMLKAGVQVVGLNRIEGALSRIRQTLTRVVQDQAVNLVHFWIPAGSQNGVKTSPRKKLDWDFCGRNLIFCWYETHI